LHNKKLRAISSSKIAKGRGNKVSWLRTSCSLTYIVKTEQICSAGRNLKKGGEVIEEKRVEKWNRFRSYRRDLVVKLPKKGG